MCDVTTWLPYDGFSPKSNRFICGQIAIELKSFMKIFQEMWTGACTQTYKQTNKQTNKSTREASDILGKMWMMNLITLKISLRSTVKAEVDIYKTQVLFHQNLTI